MILPELILLIYFLYVVIYTLVFSIAGIVNAHAAETENSQKYHKIAVLIPAYREDRVIVDTALKALEQSFPSGHYDVVVIADSLQEDTLAELKRLPLMVREVSFEQSTKVKALVAAMERIPQDYEIAVILDADNIMALDFLDKIHKTYAAGYHAIQGRRVAKNDNTKLAVLDGLSEILNNHIYREGSCGLGLSSSLIGSAMAFHFATLKHILSGMDAVGGFDRELEVKLILQGHKVRYINDALVYDEKVAKTQAFASQRKRWIASQYQYLAKYFRAGMGGLLRGNFTLFNSAVLRNIQLPRVINLGLLGFISLLAVFIRDFLYFPFWIWGLLLGALLFALVLAVPISFYNRKFFQALLSLPGTFLVMFSLLFRLKNANKEFIHTPHGDDDPKS